MGIQLSLWQIGKRRGGYTKIGTVITADLPRLSQLPIGDGITFDIVSVEEAQEVYRAYMQNLHSKINLASAQSTFVFSVKYNAWLASMHWWCHTRYVYIIAVFVYLMNEYVYNERTLLWLSSVFLIESYLINKDIILKIKWIRCIKLNYKKYSCIYKYEMKNTRIKIKVVFLGL